MLTQWYVFFEMQAYLGPQSGGEKQRVRTGVGLDIVSRGNLIYHMPSPYENKVKLTVITIKSRIIMN